MEHSFLVSKLKIKQSMEVCKHFRGLNISWKQLSANFMSNHSASSLWLSISTYFVTTWKWLLAGETAVLGTDYRDFTNWVCPFCRRTVIDCNNRTVTGFYLPLQTDQSPIFPPNARVNPEVIPNQRSTIIGYKKKESTQHYQAPEGSMVKTPWQKVRYVR